MAQRLSSRFNITHVGLCLGLKEHEVEVLLNSNSDLKDVAYQVLLKWRSGVASPQKAYSVLRKALQDCGYHQIVEEVFKC